MTDSVSNNLITLVLQSPSESLAMIDALSAEDRAEVSDDYLNRLRAITEPDMWCCGFQILLTANREAVGMGGFKGPPDADGVVEIAYGINEEHRCRGYATAAARELTAIALSDDRVRIVRAHTLPESNASARVLTRCGYRCLGEVIDPEDGRVWRWELDAIE